MWCAMSVREGAMSARGCVNAMVEGASGAPCGRGCRRAGVGAGADVRVQMRTMQGVRA